MIRTRVLRLAFGVVTALTVVSALMAGPAAQAASSSVTPVAAALTRAFTNARHLAAADVSGIRAGTLHVGSAAGHEWAIASFSPAKSAAQKVGVGFQDGAGTGVFSETHGVWRLVQTGLYDCGNGLPAALKKAWHLADLAVCTASPAKERDAAQRALSAMPARARDAAKAAATPAKAAKAAPAAAASGASLAQTISAIALSEVGTEDNPVVTNFNGVDCDPFSAMVAGFSADSDGCGPNSTFGVENENETWCSDFNKWVWEQAGVTADMNTLNAGAVSFYDWAVQNGQTPEIDTGTPEAGDSVVFFAPGNFPDFADHVGIITSVSSTGVIDMVNGDFSGGPDISAQYDTGITSLTAFGEAVEGTPGEGWVLVTPPTAAQQPVPSGHMSGPAVAVAGATGSFRASGTVPGGSVSAYYWTFGDGRTTNATGPDVTHAFSEAGLYTVSVTITSSFGTITTLEQDVRVLASSSGVASIPYDGIWYDPLPVLQDVFTRSAGGLAVDSWDGGSWLQLAVPGTPAATGNFATLSYPDAANAYNMTPHAYYRAADGSLAETYPSSSGWVTQELPGSPVLGGEIVATNTIVGAPEVFFIDTHGNLAETAEGVAGGWTTSEVVHGGPAVKAASLSLTDTTSGPEIFAVGPGGTIRVFSSLGGVWSSRGIPAQTTARGSLAALTTPDGQAAVVYVNLNGGLAEAIQAGLSGPWDVAALPGTPAANSTLAATNYLLPSMIPGTPGDFPQPPGSTTSSNAAEPYGTEAFYLTASGSPAVTFNGGTGWQTATLPGTASSIAAATAYQVEEEPSNLFLSGTGGLTEESTGARSGDPSGTWATSLTLPDTPATWADQIVLYAADPGDAAAAQAAATAAGLPSSQVITSFATAWADTLSGEYLVFAVGTPAVAALYFNVCGWANPSALPAESTPFSYNLGPTNALPGVDTFINSASDTAADTQALATDNAYYALNGTLPPGVTSMPAAVGPPFACVGSPS